jgi:hypothetical protein
MVQAQSATDSIAAPPAAAVKRIVRAPLNFAIAIASRFYSFESGFVLLRTPGLEPGRDYSQGIFSFFSLKLTFCFYVVFSSVAFLCERNSVSFGCSLATPNKIT